MAEWRAMSGWTEAQLASRLSEASRLTDSVTGDDAALTPEQGWNRVRSQAVIASETPGPPEPNGAFDHGRRLVTRFAFSDSRIVVGHWRENAHLRGRVVLLELRALGLRLLCPVRVGAVRSDSSDAETTFGYRFDTLAGHVERGREWFLLVKDHRTGEISFRIEASFRLGDFPAWWARAGFELVGRRYQRAWHRLAHAHLRGGLRRWSEEDRRARGSAPPHEDANAPVQFVAQKAVKLRPVRDVKEAEHHRRDRVVTAVAFGSVAAAALAGAFAILSLRKLGIRRSFMQIAIALVAVSLALPAFAQDRSTPPPDHRNAVEKAGDKIGGAADDAAHKGGKATGDAADSAANKVGEAADDTKAGARRTKSKATKKARRARRDAANTTGKAADDVGDAAHKAGDKAREGAQ
jgi:uncharacterized protein (UPF0548 family)